jgi:hypothetical protein
LILAGNAFDGLGIPDVVRALADPAGASRMIYL